MPRQNKTIPHQKFITKVNFKNCNNKIRHKNEKDAKNVAELQMLQKPNLELSTYKCEICNFWHLTRIK